MCLLGSSVRWVDKLPTFFAGSLVKCDGALYLMSKYVDTNNINK